MSGKKTVVTYLEDKDALLDKIHNIYKKYNSDTTLDINNLSNLLEYHMVAKLDGGSLDSFIYTPTDLLDNILTIVRKDYNKLISTLLVFKYYNFRVEEIDKLFKIEDTINKIYKENDLLKVLDKSKDFIYLSKCINYSNKELEHLNSLIVPEYDLAIPNPDTIEIANNIYKRNKTSGDGVIRLTYDPYTFVRKDNCVIPIQVAILGVLMDRYYNYLNEDPFNPGYIGNRPESVIKERLSKIETEFYNMIRSA